MRPFLAAACLALAFTGAPAEVATRIEASPPSAFRALDRAAAPPPAGAERFPYWGRIVPTGDLDGDGADDFVAWNGLEGACGCDKIDVFAYSGARGRRLWSRTVPASSGTVVAGRFGSPPKPGVLVQAYSLSGVASREPKLDLHLAAFGGDGELVWERHVTSPGRDLDAPVGGPRVVGLLEGKTASVLVEQRSTTAEHDLLEAVVVVDGAGGRVRSRNVPVIAKASAVALIGDVTRDGLGDYALVEQDGVGTIAAYDSATGKTRWRAMPLIGVQLRTVATLGDVTGDRRADVGVALPESGATILLDGRSGTLLSVVEGINAGGAGDIDGDGIADVTTAKLVRNSASVSVAAYTATGEPLASAVVDPRYVEPALNRAGDVDGDGITDWFVHGQLGWADLAPPEPVATIVSGRDARVLWRGAADKGGAVTIDGSGPDFVLADRKPFTVSAFDGTTGKRLWRSAATSPSFFEQTAIVDVNADGHADVLAAANSEEDGYVVYALNGADGSTLWRLTSGRS